MYFEATNKNYKFNKDLMFCAIVRFKEFVFFVDTWEAGKERRIIEHGNLSVGFDSEEIHYTSREIVGTKALNDHLKVFDRLIDGERYAFLCKSFAKYSLDGTDITTMRDRRVKFSEQQKLF